MPIIGEEPFEEDLEWLKYGREMIQQSPKILDEAAKSFLTLGSSLLTVYTGALALFKFNERVLDLFGWVVICILAVMGTISLGVMIGKTLYLARAGKANAAFINNFRDNSRKLLRPESLDTQAALGDAALRVAQPASTDAKAADVTDLLVDHQQLAMVARKPAERTAELERVVDAHFAARFQQRCPEARRGLSQAAEPVAQHADAHAGCSALDQRIAERATEFVVAEDVVLEQDRFARVADRRQPRIEGRARIDQQFERIAFDQRRTRGATERLLGEQAQGGAVRRRAGRVGHPSSVVGTRP